MKEGNRVCVASSVPLGLLRLKNRPPIPVPVSLCGRAAWCKSHSLCERHNKD